MNWQLLILTGAAISGLATASSASGTGDVDGDAAKGSLERQCQAAETSAPEACACMIERGRELRLSDVQIAGVLFGGATGAPINPANIGRLRRARYECIRETMQARMLGDQAAQAQNPAPDGTYNARPIRGRPLPSDQYIGQAPSVGTSETDQEPADDDPCSGDEG